MNELNGALPFVQLEPLPALRMPVLVLVPTFNSLSTNARFDLVPCGGRCRTTSGRDKM